MEVKIDRVAFSLFGVDIMWYAIIICFGIMAGLFVATKNSKLRNIKKMIFLIYCFLHYL